MTYILHSYQYGQKDEPIAEEDFHKHCKKCSMCKKEKPYPDFNKDKRRKHGLKSICRDCQKDYMRNYKAKRQNEYMFDPKRIIF